MSTYAYGLMLEPGKTDELRRLTSDLRGARKAEHEDYMRRYHLTKEYGWIESTRMGDMFVVYFEATDDFLAENRAFAASTHPFDVWYKQQAGPILGQDLNVPFPAGFVEILYETQDVPASGREKPFAIVAPLLPGKTDAMRQLAAELLGPKREDLRASHRRLNQVKENFYLEHTPQGDLFVYYSETPDPAATVQRFGESRDAFDLWWKERVLDVSGIDYNQPFPGPLPELILATTMPMVGAPG